MHLNIRESYRPPSWARGYISFEDAAFLDETVRSIKPRAVVEVGVASGCSSAMLLRSLANLDPSGHLYSYDLAERCYFDTTRVVGSAVEEMEPNLAAQWTLVTGGTAIDAGAAHLGQAIAMAFIDADHRHPWPTLDLLGLLPALAEDATVVLHDVALTRVTGSPYNGPEIIFSLWRGSRWVASGQGNIGAVKLPGNRERAREWLLRCLQEPWQSFVPAETLDALDIPHEARRSLPLRKVLASDLLEKVRSIAAERREIIIWGAGGAGHELLGLLRLAGQLPSGFVDRDPRKIGQQVEGIPVTEPERLATGECRPFVLIASMFAADISQALRLYGYNELSDYIIYEPVWVEEACAEDASLRVVVPLLGMTTKEEQDFLFDVGRRWLSGNGAVVDLGCWLGSTTIPLAKGLEAAGAPNERRILAYDTFVWRKWMEPHAGNVAGRFQSGDSFLAEFQRRLGPWANRVEARERDLSKEKWTEGPIEFLLIDAMKNWELCASIARAFMSALVPGCSRLLHQDFKFWGCPWIHILMYRMRASFELEVDLPASPSTLFRSVKTIDPQMAPGSPSEVLAAEVEAAYAHWMSLISGPLAAQLVYARILALCEIGEMRLAADGLQQILDSDDFVTEAFLSEMRKRFAGTLAVAFPEHWQASLQKAQTAARPVFLWGAGSGAQALLRRIPELAQSARAVIDSNPSKTGLEIGGLPIVSADDFADSLRAGAFVVVATSFAAEVTPRLRELGLRRFDDYCVADLV